MKALSIRQPWAWLIVNSHKHIENCDWPTKFRGRFLIHASKGVTGRSTKIPGTSQAPWASRSQASTNWIEVAWWGLLISMTAWIRQNPRGFSVSTDLLSTQQNRSRSCRTKASSDFSKSRRRRCNDPAHSASPRLVRLHVLLQGAAVMTHQPKGGMCAVCVHVHRNCSQLPFSSMPALARDAQTVIVRYTNFQRRSGEPNNQHPHR